MTLETERLLLRPWRVSEAAIQHELWAERDHRAPPHRRLDADGRPNVRDLEERIRTAAEPSVLGLWALERKDSENVLGYCGLIENTRGPADEPELAYELLRRHWGRGYATEAASAVVEWAGELGYLRLWAGVREWNTASLRVLEKVGFSVTERRERDAAYGDTLLTTRVL